MIFAHTIPLWLGLPLLFAYAVLILVVLAMWWDFRQARKGK